MDMIKRDIAELVSRISKATRKFEKKFDKKKDDEHIQPHNLYKLFAEYYDECLVEEVIRVANKLLVEFSAATNIDAKHAIHWKLVLLVNAPHDYLEPEITDANILGFW
jgi:deoxyadenosine/deoxycytidine kinase